VWDNLNDREIVLPTNYPDFGATTIAAIYKDRREIELFFKALKQNLKVTSFVGISENALRIRIWTALLTILPLKMDASPLQRPVAAPEPRLHGADEPLYVPQFDSMARQPIRHAANKALAFSPSRGCSRRFWTAVTSNTQLTSFKSRTNLPNSASRSASGSLSRNDG
jgi:hypothetical protein